MDLSKYIEELLYTNDCVIIPNIGGFIVHYNTANIDLVEQQISPPYQQVSFNPKLVTNDGVIANYMVQKEKISYKEAAQKVEKWSLQIEQDLFYKKIVHFAKIGKLYFNTDSKLEFVPEQTNFLLDTYAMPAVACYPVLRNKQYLKTAATASATITNKQKITTQSTAIATKATASKTAAFTVLRSKKAKIAVVAIALLLLVPFVVKNWWSTSTTDNPVLAQSPKTNSTSETSSASILSIGAKPQIATKPIVSEPIIDKVDSVATITETEQTEEDLITAQVVTENTKTFLVILGAFGKESNAKRLAQKLEKDSYLPVIDQSSSGLHRVGAQITCTAEEFPTHFEYIKENYNKKAWLVK